MACSRSACGSSSVRRSSAIQVGLRVLRIEGQCMAEIFNRLGVPRRPIQHAPAIVIGAGMLGSQAHRRIEVGERLGKVPEFVPGPTSIEVGLGVRRIQGDRAVQQPLRSRVVRSPVGGDGLLQKCHVVSPRQTLVRRGTFRHGSEFSRAKERSSGDAGTGQDRQSQRPVRKGQTEGDRDPRPMRSFEVSPGCDVHWPLCGERGWSRRRRNRRAGEERGGSSTTGTARWPDVFP